MAAKKTEYVDPAPPPVSRLEIASLPKYVANDCNANVDVTNGIKKGRKKKKEKKRRKKDLEVATQRCAGTQLLLMKVQLVPCKAPVTFAHTVPGTCSVTVN